MALNPGVLYSALVANRASGGFPFSGVNYDRLAAGVASGIVSWGVGQPQNLALLGAATGISGTGTIVPTLTKVIVPPNPAPVSAALRGAGMNGPLANSLAVAIALGVAQAFSSAAQYTGIVGAVAVGSDVSKIVVANGAALTAILQGTLAGALGAGPALPMLALGLGNGISGLLLQGTGTGAVNGVPTTPPIPSSGPTNTVVV